MTAINDKGATFDLLERKKYDKTITGTEKHGLTLIRARSR